MQQRVKVFICITLWFIWLGILHLLKSENEHASLGFWARSSFLLSEMCTKLGMMSKGKKPPKLLHLNFFFPSCWVPVSSGGIWSVMLFVCEGKRVSVLENCLKFIPDLSNLASLQRELLCRHLQKHSDSVKSYRISFYSFKMRNVKIKFDNSFKL